MSLLVLKADGIIPVTHAEHLLLSQVGARLDDRHCPTEEELIAHGREAAALLTIGEPVTARVIGELRRCRIISRFGIGLDNVDIEAATRAGIAVSTVPDAAVDEVSDHALALVLALARKLVPLDQAVRSGCWSTLEVVGEVHRLRGQVFGLVGFGRTAQRLAPKVAALGLRVWAYDPHVPSERIAAAEVVPTSFAELLSGADFISLHAPLTAETRHLVGAEALRLMKPTAYLVNVSRGGLVDTAALEHALEDGWIAGAGLDVFEQEPPPPDLGLLRLPNVVLTSHAAYHSAESLAEIRAKAFEEVARVLAGEAPLRAANHHALTESRKVTVLDSKGGGSATV